MTIPANPAVPNLPLAPNDYDRQYVDKLTNVLRLYFNQLNAANATVLSQISSSQTLLWLGV
jgi:hypothetical protein